LDYSLEKLAKKIINYSLNLQSNERVLISYSTLADIDLLKCLIKEILLVKSIPYVAFNHPTISYLLVEGTTDERIKLLKDLADQDVYNYDAFINVRYNYNDYEGKDVDKNILAKIGSKLKESHDIRINQKKWVLLNYPSLIDSFKAKMSTSDYRNFALEVMNVDYNEMNKKIEPLKRLMEQTDKVRITGKNTDITFSIKGMPIIPCVGDKNIPDGEIYVAPIKDSVNGIITYNTPSPYQGNIYNNVSLTFKDGQIVTATADNDVGDLNKIFNIDEGSRYIGEFSLGLNPKILHPIGDILYDEKIIGSLHFTPGAAYKDSYNGNDSSIHWDMVLIQREEYGGGDIYFDDLLIRHNGMFVLEELKELNYNN
jgi:aminopeptidase